VPLADGIGRLLRRQNVDVGRESVAATDTDFSSIVANVGDDVDVVVFATQTASQAQTMSQQLREQGKRAVVFGTDGVYSPSQYKPRTGYVSIFAADLHFLSSARSIVREYNRFSKNKTFGAFGPPTYMASWIAMDAIVRACGDGNVSRAELTPLVQRSNTPSILGGNIRFNGKGDIVGAKFALYKVTNGKYSPVG
jgi:ABC-type branched-subunit amino acid transport system substrate-binding protein